MTDTRVLVLVGSLRAESVNRRLAKHLEANAPAGVTVEIVEGLADVPFYSEELDGEQIPAAAQALREKIAGGDGVLAITPEYNGTMPAVLNNAIDWLSRPYGQGALTGKPFAAVGATPTPYGGKWSHEDARRSAKVAGAVVLDHIEVSHGYSDVDPVADAEVTTKLLGAVAALASHQGESAA